MAALLCCLISIVSFAFWAAAETNSLLPYAISFGDDIAIRMTHDGRIEATVQEYEKAEWEVFLAEGSSWYTQYTQEEYKAIMAEYDSVNSFAAMQKSSDYVDVSASCYGTLAAVHADGTVAFNKRAEDRYSTSADNSKWRNVKSIALGAYSIIAQKNDGTMIVDASTSEAFTQGVNPKNWKNVTAIDLDYLAVGLREDGRAYYAAPNYISDDAEGFVPLKNILK